MKKIILFCISLISVFGFMSNSFAYCPEDGGPCYEPDKLKDIKDVERDSSCATSKDCIDKPTFTIKTNDFSIGGSDLKKEGDSSEQIINQTFGVFIKKMMIGLIMLSSFVMTVGAGYMILYFGQDEYLTRGKTIFKMGLVSIIIALSSYYMVNLVTYILYK